MDQHLKDAITKAVRERWPERGSFHEEQVRRQEVAPAVVAEQLLSIPWESGRWRFLTRLIETGVLVVNTNPPRHDPSLRTRS